MSITVGTSGSNSADTPSNTVTVSAFQVTAGTDCIIVLACAGNPTLGTRTVSGVTWNGTPLTRLASAAADNGNFLRTDVFYLLSPTAGTGDCVVTMGGSNLICFASITNLQGVDQTTPFGTPVLGNSTTTNSPSVSVSSAAGEYVFGAVASDANATITETGTLIGEAEAMNADACFGSQYFSGSASVTVSWTASTPDNGWAVTGFAVKPAGSGPGAGSDSGTVGVTEGTTNLVTVRLIEETS